MERERKKESCRVTKERTSREIQREKTAMVHQERHRKETQETQKIRQKDCLLLRPRNNSKGEVQTRHPKETQEEVGLQRQGDFC